jgi:hypothetical protein
VATFQSWTVPSVLAAATVVPSGLNATASTGSRPELIGAPVSCPVAAAHSRMFPSESAVATVSPSGLNVAALAASLAPIGRAVIVARLARSHCPASPGPATSRALPPGVNASVSTAELQVVVLTSWCEVRSHNLMVWSVYPAARL